MARSHFSCIFLVSFSYSFCFDFFHNFFYYYYFCSQLLFSMFISHRRYRFSVYFSLFRIPPCVLIMEACSHKIFGWALQSINPRTQQNRMLKNPSLHEQLCRNMLSPQDFEHSVFMTEINNIGKQPLFL